MKHDTKLPPSTPPVPHPPVAEDPKKRQEIAEALEVSGRHKNSGQKDHKGAR